VHLAVHVAWRYSTKRLLLLQEREDIWHVLHDVLRILCIFYVSLHVVSGGSTGRRKGSGGAAWLRLLSEARFPSCCGLALTGHHRRLLSCATKSRLNCIRRLAVWHRHDGDVGDFAEGAPTAVDWLLRLLGGHVFGASC